MNDACRTDCCRPLAAGALSEREAAATAAVFRALGDPARVRLVSLIAAAGEPVCQCELTAPVGLTQGTVSHHLKKLVAAGLVRREQRGIWAYYEVDREALARVAALVSTEGAAA